MTVSKVLPVSLVFFLLVVVPAQAQNAQNHPVFISSAAVPAREPGLVLRKSVDEVHLSFTVIGKDKRPVLGLHREQIEVRDNQRTVDAIVDFRSDAGLPLQLALMIDASSSMEKDFAAKQRLAVDFVRQVVRPQMDRTLLMAFAARPQLLAGGDSDPAELARAIGRLRPEGITGLYDALVQGCEQLEKLPAGPARRAIVLLSDGLDNYSLHTLKEAITEAHRLDAPVYAISLHKPRRFSAGDDVLRLLAMATGGRAFIVSRPAQLSSAFAQIEQELRSQYVVAFRPSPPQRDGRFHTLQVSVPGARGLDIRARAGYWSPSEDVR